MNETFQKPSANARRAAQDQLTREPRRSTTERGVALPYRRLPGNTCEMETARATLRWLCRLPAPHAPSFISATTPLSKSARHLCRVQNHLSISHSRLFLPFPGAAFLSLPPWVVAPATTSAAPVLLRPRPPFARLFVGDECCFTLVRAALSPLCSLCGLLQSLVLFSCSG